MKKFLMITTITLGLFVVGNSVFAQEAGGNYPGLNNYPTLEKVCDYQFTSTLKYAKCEGKYGLIAGGLTPKLFVIEKSIYKKYPNKQTRTELLNKLSLKIGIMKKDNTFDTTKIFILEFIQQEIDSWIKDDNSVDNPINFNCTIEGETYGNIGLESEVCCSGMEATEYRGGTSLCYNPKKGKPQCVVDGHKVEGRYYNDNSLLKEDINCVDNVIN